MAVADKKTTFNTLGMVLVPLKIRDVADNWHRLDIWCHVIDSDDKCLVNNIELHKTHGFRFYYGNNMRGREGSCMIGKDGIIFPLSLDANGMPMLPTHNAPVVTLSKPDTLEDMLKSLKGTEVKKATKASHYTEIQASTSGSVSEQSDSDQEDITEHELFCMLAQRAKQRQGSKSTKQHDQDDEDQDDDEEEMRLPPGSKKKKKKKRALAKRSIEPIHTPESWHALIHAGKDISEKTIRSMQGLVFKIDGKVIKGENMTKEHFETLDQARLTCRICKQTKMVAPATRKGIPTCLNCYRSFFDGGNHHTLIDAPVP